MNSWQKTAFLTFCALAGGCGTLHQNSPSQPQTQTPTAVVAPNPEGGGVKLQAADYADIPGWSTDMQSLAVPALLGSCTVLDKEGRWQPFCAALRGKSGSSDAAIRNLVETYLTPYRAIAENGSTTGLVTGYYEPVLRGSRSRHAPYLTPLYRVPPDLIDVDPSVATDASGGRLRGRLVGHTLVPYPTRAEISSSHLLAGQELVWVEDPVEAFFLQIQGSGKVQIIDRANPETIRVAFADQNGQPYRSIGKWLIEQHELAASDASMQGIKTWTAAHPDRAEQLFNVNPRVVFFREEKLPDFAAGPKGALGIPLSDGRSIAVDPKVVPLGAPVFIATTVPMSSTPMQRLVSAQDTGSAIVTAPGSAVRIDLYFGSGSVAGENAGRMKQPGQLWVLLPTVTP